MGIHLLDGAIVVGLYLTGWAVLALLARSDNVQSEREEEQ